MLILTADKFISIRIHIRRCTINYPTENWASAKVKRPFAESSFSTCTVLRPYEEQWQCLSESPAVDWQRDPVLGGYIADDELARGTVRQRGASCTVTRTLQTLTTILELVSIHQRRSQVLGARTLAAMHGLELRAEKLSSHHDVLPTTLMVASLHQEMICDVRTLAHRRNKKDDDRKIWKYFYFKSDRL